MTTRKLNHRKFNVALEGTALAASVDGATFAGEISTLMVGDIEVSVLSDGHLNIPPAFFNGVDQSKLDGLGETVEIGANVWLVRTGGRVILVDTGAGEVLSGMFPTVGQLDAFLAGANVVKSEVTDIVLTHMHADHIGGLNGEGAGAYANAKIHVSETEWSFWTNPDLLSAASEEEKPTIQLVQSIASPIADRITTHTGEADLGDGLTFVPLPGHTPGHSGVRVTSNSESLLLVGDAIISQELQLASPNVSFALDADPELAVRTRVKLLNQLADEGVPFAATHFAQPGVGIIEREGEAFRFVPMD